MSSMGKNTGSIRRNCKQWKVPFWLIHTYRRRRRCIKYKFWYSWWEYCVEEKSQCWKNVCHMENKKKKIGIKSMIYSLLKIDEIELSENKCSNCKVQLEDSVDMCEILSAF